jgi:hypothetical protein
MDRFKVGLGLALVTGMTVLTGCVGYVDGGGYGGAVVAPGPDVFFGFDRGRDVRAFSHRGAVSRGFAHGGGRR